MERTITIDGVEKTVSVERKGDGYRLAIDGREYDVTNATLADGILNFFVGHDTHRAVVSETVFGKQISLGGRDYIVAGEDDDAAVGGGHHGGDGSVEAPMPGNIISVSVKPGDSVKAGAPLVILESMKMQNSLTAPVAGDVKAVNCAAGDQVSYGQVLVEIEPSQ